MKRRADGSFLPENLEGTCRRAAGLSGVNADRFHEEKTDFVCPGSQKNKFLDHAYQVTAVTDSNNPGLVMFSHSASAIFAFAAGSSSGEIQVDFARVSTELTFLEEARIKNSVSAENGSSIPGPIANKYVRAISRATHTTPKLIELNYLKTATSTV